MHLPYPVILASGSPRRRELLQDLISNFRVVVSDVEEIETPGEPPEETAMRLAHEKARQVFLKHPDSLVIGGDTVVALPNGNQLAKPLHAEDAVRMLSALSGRSHFVITGVALSWPEGECVFCDTTTVTFRDLTVDDIREYVASGEPMDKAGAYAIQGGAAKFAVKIEGSRSNVVGLPVEPLQARLEMLFGTD